MQKNKIIVFAIISVGTFLLIVIPKKLGLNWVEVSGVVFGVYAFSFTAFQIIKSNTSEEKSSLKELEDELKALIDGCKEEFSAKDKVHDDDLKTIRQETALLPIVIQENFRIKEEISGLMRDIEQLSAGIAQALKYAELLKRQSNVEKLLKSEKTKSYQTLMELLRRLEELEEEQKKPPSDGTPKSSRLQKRRNQRTHRQVKPQKVKCKP